jgi:putative nucleotidyltransferase with HDIG domain
MSQATLQRIEKKLAEIGSLPTIPTLLVPLLQHLCEPAEDVSLDRVVKIIAQDPSLAAQCLRMVNSPLFGVRYPIETVRGAVMGLGVNRVRQIAIACSLLKAFGPQSAIPARALWAHSLAVAMVAQKFSQEAGYPDPEQAYSAGLLHDLGILVALAACPAEFESAAQAASREHRALHLCERELNGFDHCEIGARLAQRWQFPAPYHHVMRYHHEVEQAPEHRCLVAIVSLCDILCRLRNLGYGFEEIGFVDLAAEPAWGFAAEELPKMRDFDLARFTLELDAFITEVEQSVAALFELA